MDPPIWQLRSGKCETAQNASSDCAAYTSPLSSPAALEPLQFPDPTAAAAASTSDIVSSRYLANVTPDARVHVFRETTV